MNAIDILRLSYLGAASGVLFIFCVPPLRSRFLAYGPRKAVAAEDSKRDADTSTTSTLSATLDRAATITVPHSWFSSFYLVSVAMALYWLTKIIIRNGPAFRLVVASIGPHSSSMTIEQVLVTWAMMFVQSGRRLYECLVFSYSSKSEMWIGHWILGILFYITVNIAIWIEGSLELHAHIFCPDDFIFRAPSLRTTISVLIFLLATGFQHDCHAYLAHLKSSVASTRAANNHKAERTTYKLPTHPAFRNIIAPHYTAECFIYLALAINAAPAGDVVNKTLTCALIFVVVNLGVTAHGTKQWYETQFGAEALKGRCRMIPLLY